MITKDRSKTVLAIAAVALSVFAGPAQALEGELGILTPETLSGNNPATGEPWEVGDSYRFAFFTSAKHDAVSADISTYNAWVQGLADATTAYDIGAVDGATWKVIGSTDEVDARDNTGTNPTVETGHAIFLLDGTTLVANDYADLWDGEIQNIINIDENGATFVDWPFTGSLLDGTAAGTQFGPLGRNVNGRVTAGNSNSTTEWIWRTWTGGPAENEGHMYAMSDPLVIVGLPDANVPEVDAGADVITWSGQAVQLDPNVVNNDTEVPQRPLSYAWSADPADGVEFDPNEFVEAPGVTITKVTDNPSVVTMTLAVILEGKDPVTDSTTIDVYDDSCLAAGGAGMLVLDPTDLDGNCITAFEDFAVMAMTWLDDYSLTEPVAK